MRTDTGTMSCDGGINGHTLGARGNRSLDIRAERKLGKGVGRAQLK